MTKKLHLTLQRLQERNNIWHCIPKSPCKCFLKQEYCDSFKQLWIKKNRFSPVTAYSRYDWSSLLKAVRENMRQRNTSWSLSSPTPIPCISSREVKISSYLYWLLPIWPQAILSNILMVEVFIYKVGMKNHNSYLIRLSTLNELIFVKHWEHCLTHSKWCLLSMFTSATLNEIVLIMVIWYDFCLKYSWCLSFGNSYIKPLRYSFNDIYWIMYPFLKTLKWIYNNIHVVVIPLSSFFAIMMFPSCEGLCCGMSLALTTP